MKPNSGHRAATMLPAAKQDASPAFTGDISKPAQTRRCILLSRIEAEEDGVSQVLALSVEEFERLSSAAKLIHRIHMSLLAGWKAELVALDTAQVNNQGGAR